MRRGIITKVANSKLIIEKNLHPRKKVLAKNKDESNSEDFERNLEKIEDKKITKKG